MKKYFYLFIVVMLSTTTCVLSRHVYALPQHSPIPGGIAVISIPDAARDVAYNNHPVMVLKHESQRFAIVGIPLSAKAGVHKLKVGNGTQAFSVVEKIYKEQHLTIKDKRKVNPYADDMDRILQEKAEMGRAFANFGTKELVQTDFVLPVNGPISSPFGLKRFLNKQARSPHSGLDIAAASGVEIKATAAGRVVARGNYFFSGNTVLLDHGQGLITMYCHMSKINVLIGDELDSGNILGEVGMTGRVTGPHLHWSVSLNNVKVDPNLFLKKEKQVPTN